MSAAQHDVTTGQMLEDVTTVTHDKMSGIITTSNRWSFVFDLDDVSGHITVKRHVATEFSTETSAITTVRVVATSDNARWEMQWRSDNLVSPFDEARYVEFLDPSFVAAVERVTGLDLSAALRPAADV